MWRYFSSFGLYRRSRSFSIYKHCLIIALLLCSLLYILLKIKLLIDYHHAYESYQATYPRTCPKYVVPDGKKAKVILFWTRIFSRPINQQFVNHFLFKPSGRCGTDRCRVIVNRQELCQSDAIVFHARGGIRTYDMPDARLPHQRYVFLTKEPPYKTTAIVGYLNDFFNWTATYRVDSDIDYRYFRWQRKHPIDTQPIQQSYLNNRQASAASMVSNCYSENNREDYIERLNSIIPVNRVGYCSKNKCEKTRYECLNELADIHPFYLAFENSLCNDYVTEKYANVILNGRMIPIVYSKSPHLYIPNSYIDASEFSSPEDLGQFLIQLVKNTTAYDSYFQWRNEYELIVPDEHDYLCELCTKLHNPNEPEKVYHSMKKWLYKDAQCQRWISKLNRTIDIPVDETMDYEDPWI